MRAFVQSTNRFPHPATPPPLTEAISAKPLRIQSYRNNAPETALEQSALPTHAAESQRKKPEYKQLMATEHALTD